MTQKTTSPQSPWNMDVRVRERNLKAGTLTEKDLEKHLAALPDLADQSESFATSQPALAQPPQQHHVAPVVDDSPESSDDEDDDEDDDVDGDGDGDGAAGGTGGTNEGAEDAADGEGTP